MSACLSVALVCQSVCMSVCLSHLSVSQYVPYLPARLPS
jgi:hypothetical protein